MSGFAQIPFIGGFLDNGDSSAIDAQQDTVNTWKGVKPTDQKYGTYTPQQYSSAGTYMPQQANYQTVQEDPNLLSNQTSYLNQLAGLSNQGLSAQDKAGFEAANEEAGQQAAGQRGALQHNAEARGVGGGGLSYALQEQANQGGTQRAQQAMLGQASTAAAQRALYNQAYGQALGQQRNQNFNTANTNANTINKFNMYNSNANNQAQAYNLGENQKISNANTTGYNQAQQYNIGNAYNAGQNNIKNNFQWAGGVGGANSGLAQADQKQTQDDQAARKQNEDNSMKIASMMGI